MIVEGNWFSTTMNLEPRLEKPPLPTWLTAFSALLFGGFDNLFVMRLPGAMAATAMVFFFFGFCREIKKEGWFAFLGASFLATSLLMVQIGRTNSWDIYTHVFIVGSIWQLAIAMNRKKQIHVLYSMIFMGLSVLSKGPVSLYALWLPYVISMIIGYGKPFIIENWKKLTAILIGGLIIGFSWNVCMAIFQPEASEFVINKETNSWANRHVRPFYFYLHFPVYIGVWTILVLSSFFYKYAKPVINKFSNYKFVLSWILLVIFFLSVIPTKKERYMLPVMVPLCLAAASIAENLYLKYKSNSTNKWDNLIFVIHSIIIF
jgi:4-amino-4-deoxy-L-arabinose transferase-like glycosyltransferase